MKLVVEVASELAARVVRAIREMGILAEVDILNESSPTQPPPAVKLSSKLAQVLGEEETDDDDVPAMVRLAATNQRINRAATLPPARKPSTRVGAAVLYTPSGTRREMTKALDALRAGSFDALVLADVMDHPESRNAEIRARLAKKIEKSGRSVESVDNIVWKLVNKGLLEKVTAE